ncbi:MurR/RpiR family transcriptional regulator [Clostridium polynesiense]|uniref:MurR/RpiR family transcriptional regulator n=1 Tax=Clostridium polynesiense TaxID=1325933 RepID=UPI00058CCDBC|nr:MurR/RpiR family transcriptional regulator [Clostridium polynesiense]
MDFFTIIEKNRDKLNKNEGELLKFFIDNAKNIKSMRIQDLSKSTFMSTAAIIRFCKKLGFTGYTELKNNLIFTMENQNRQISFNNEVTTFEDIERTKQLINESIVDEVLDLIFNANRVDFYGEGSSRSVCREMARRFQLIGKQCFYYDDTTIMYSSAATLESNDLVFSVSMSGETAQVIKASNIAKSRGAKVVSITNMSINTLSSLSDRTIFISSTKYSIRNMNFISRIPALVIMEYIFYRYMDKYIGK